MKELLFYRDQILDRGRNTIEELGQAMSLLKEEQWPEVQRERGITPHLALARLAAQQIMMYSPIIDQLHRQSDKPLPNFNQQLWLENEYDESQDWRQVYNAWSEAFTMMLEEVVNLDSAWGWSFSARHPWFGVRTLQWWFEQSLAATENALVVIES